MNIVFWLCVAIILVTLWALLYKFFDSAGKEVKGTFKRAFDAMKKDDKKDDGGNEE